MVRRDVLVLAWFVTLVAPALRAEPVPSLDLRGFQPPADPRGALYLEPADTVGPGAWNVGVYASYANRLVTLEDGAGEVAAIPLEHQLALDYLASLGVGERFALSLALPSVVYQDGDDLTALVPDGGTLPRTALGDPALGAKVSLLTPDKRGAFALAALGRVTVPLGDERSYVGEGALGGDVRLLAELAASGLALRGAVGARFRGELDTYLGERFGHELPWGLGLAVRPEVFSLDAAGRWEVHAEAHGAVAVTPTFAAGPQSPAVAGVAARYRIGDVSVLAGVELPLGSAVGVPRARGVLGVGWAPRFYDADDDGIADDRDACPAVAEDPDGVEDADGCIDFDNDHDGVADASDLCPAEAEDRDEHRDDDGCADLDNDGDGLLDAQDACPDAVGTKQESGCPVPDTDRDGILDTKDWCRDRPEDRDGYQDDDGCPDLDNDGDGVPDGDDACPVGPGLQRSDPALSGCPDPDRDGDTFDDTSDTCPAEPEDFDEDRDADGCADADPGGRPAARPLVTLEMRGAEPLLRWRIAPSVVREGERARVADAGRPTLRAVAQVLNAHPGWVALVGVRPRGTGDDAQSVALAEAFVLVAELRALTHRDDAAESVGWDAVARQPGAAQAGVGVIVVTGAPGERP